jgi:S1-C subfamily serine protease
MKPARLPIVTWIMALVVSVTLVAPRAVAQDVGERVYRTVLKSIAWVLVPNGDGRMRTGTATLVDGRRRILLTNYHVVGDKNEAIALFPVVQKNKVVAEKDFYRQILKRGQGIAGKVIARDKKRDLALIELTALPQGIVPLSLAANSASPGQDVHSVGNPGASEGLWVYTRGTVRQVLHQKWRSKLGKEDVLDLDAEVVLTQSPINPGDSGGPLVNSRGELLGVTQGVALDAAQFSVFVDVSEVKTFVASKKLTVRAAPPITGSSASPLDTARPADTQGTAATADLQERRAASKLKLVKDVLAAGNKERAIDRLEELVKEYPNTKAAEEAKQLLTKIKK